MVLGKLPMMEGPEVNVQTTPPGPVTFATAPLVGEATTVVNVGVPEIGAVKVILGDAGGTMLKPKRGC